MSEFAGTARFEIVRRIGAGGMGVVYEAFDREQGALVALKTLRNVSAQSLYLLKNEFRSLQDLEHPNLVNLGELIEESGQWFFTMELIAGTDLLSWVTGVAHTSDSASSDALAATVEGSTDSFPGAVVAAAPAARCDEGRLRAALPQLAAGLAELHRAGKVHRDVKPSNVRVAPSGRVVLLDFGLITDANPEDLSSDGHVVGTAAYMAPEQAASKPVGPEADWYAVGVVLYEALTGMVPFTGTALEIFMDKQRHEPPPPRALVPDVPRDLDALCSELLRFYPQERPTGRDVLKRLGVAAADLPSAPSSSRGTDTGNFVGREAETRLLEEAFSDTRWGAAVTVAISGESGMGKSALVRHFTWLARQRADTVVLAGRCYERESVPYKAFDGVVDALSRHLLSMNADEVAALVPPGAALLRRVFPVLGRVEPIAEAPPPPQDTHDPHELRGRVFATLRELLRGLTARSPLVLVIDDLQWADADSQLLLDDLLRPPNAPPLLLLVTTRSEARGALSLPGDVRRIDLEPLEPEAARRLARLLLRSSDAPEGASAAEIAVEAKGHPLYIDELVRHASLSAEPRREKLRLDDAIRVRVGRLPEPAHQLLELATVAAAPMPQEVLRHAARGEPVEFARTVSVLRVAHLIRGRTIAGKSWLEPYHDRVRAAVAGGLDDEATRAHHTRLAIALEAAPRGSVRPEALLRHLEGAGRAEQAAKYATEAARAAAEAFAFDRAASLYRSALRLGGYARDERRALVLALADALAYAGSGAEAAEQYMRAAADATDGSSRRSLRRKAMEQWLSTGHLDQGLAALEALLRDVGDRLHQTPGRALATLARLRIQLGLRGLKWTERSAADIPDADLTRLDIYHAAGQSLGMIDNVRANVLMTKSLLLALKLGEPLRLARALALESIFHAAQGGKHLAQSRRLVEETEGIAERTGEDDTAVIARFASAMNHYFAGHYRTSLREYDRVEQLTRAHPTETPLFVTTARLFRINAVRHLGQLKEHRRVYERSVADAVRRGNKYAETSMRRAAVEVWLAADDPNEGRAELARVSWTPPVGHYHAQHWFELQAHAWLALYEDACRDRIDELTDGFARLNSSLLNRVFMIRAVGRSLWGRICLRLAAERAGDRSRWLSRARKAAKQLMKETGLHARVIGPLLAAGVAAESGDEARADALLGQTIAVAESNDLLAQCANVARLRRARLTGGAGADALVARAMQWMDREEIANPERFANLVAPGF